MKVYCSYKLILIIFTSSLFCETLPLTKRYFHNKDLGHEYKRGTYLIVLADADLENILRDESTGDFVYFKQTQGFNVKVVTLDHIGINNEIGLKDYFNYYFNSIDSLLEYILMVGDINGSYAIPTFSIPSYNESDLDVTDYPYTYFNDNTNLDADYFIGRWSIRSKEDLKKVKSRSIQYVLMENVPDSSYLNNALLVAGNYSDSGTWPVTPVWTSKWLMDELRNYGFPTIDTAFYHLSNQQVNNPQIHTSWNNGIGIINYRGWGDANGWHYPLFHRENITDWLNNGWYMPVVMSFVCNTGDFGNDYSGVGLAQSFGEYLITAGSINNPKGAVAMIGPSDLDTDTRFNNVMCAVMWDEMLEGRIPELAPALHAGKQALIKEFGDLEVNGTNIVEFYHHVYGVLGDPSLQVWLKEPEGMVATLDDGIVLQDSINLNSSFIFINVTNSEGEKLNDVVGALLYNKEIIAKGLSNHIGELMIDFDDIPENKNLELYLNKPNYYQKKIILTYLNDNGDIPTTITDYAIQSNITRYNYVVSETEYEWKELNHKIDANLYLNDDSTIKNKKLNFDFRYYGSIFDNLTICSNGWVSFMPCLEKDGQFSSCSTLPYFFNNSIPHPLGPYGMIAPFFDDLDDNQGQESFDVYFWTNSTDSAIVEWDNVANGQTDENCPNCEKEKFQVILTNSGLSTSNDGEIIFQYKEIHDIDNHGSTIGIESPDKNNGTEYLFNYAFNEDEYSLQNEFAIKFSPQCSQGVIPDECGVCGGVGKAPWYKDLDGDGLGNIEDELLACDRPDNFVKFNSDIDDNCTCPDNNDSCYDCNGICGGSDIIDECGNCGGDGTECMGNKIIIIPEKYHIASHPNPFNPITEVSFAIPEMELASVRVFDIRGREMATLANQIFQPGYYSVNWDASTYASGVYFINLMTSNTKLTQKVLLLK